MFRLRPYIWIILIGVIVYAKTLSFGFTYFDDNRLILDNKNFLSNPSNAKAAFRQDVLEGPSGIGIYYRPLLTLSFMLDTQIGGANPFIYHLTNLILHLLASSLLFLLLQRLNYTKTSAFICSLAFTVHPVLTQDVAWIPGRNDALLTIFILLSLIQFVKFLDTDNIKNYCLHLLFFALALLTKESAVFLILIGYLYLHLVVKEKFFSGCENALIAGWLVTLGSWFWIRKIFLPNPASIDLFYIIKHAILSLPAMIQFIGKIILPFNLSVFPVMKDTAFIYGYIAMILIAFILLISKKIRSNFVIFGTAWFIFFLLPSFVFLNSAQIAGFMEHRLYLPLIGFFIILSESAPVRDFDVRRKYHLILAALALFIFSIITFRYSDDFKNKINFWTNAVKNSPHSLVCHINLGYVYFTDKSFDNAAEEFKKAIAVGPDRAVGYNYLGACYMEKGMFKEAEVQFRKALAISPSSDDIRHNLANAYFKEGKLGQAELLLKRLP